MVFEYNILYNKFYNEIRINDFAFKISSWNYTVMIR